MINLNYNDDHIRLGATCYQCEKLYTTDEEKACKLKKDILSDTIECCNFAAYGCVHFKGDYVKLPNPKMIHNIKSNPYRDINKKIREHLLQGNSFKLSMCKEWGITKMRLHNNLVVLEKRGYEIIRSKDLTDKVYTLKITKNGNN